MCLRINNDNKTMKKPLITLFLFISSLGFAQFNRIIQNPLTENPSYIGSTGKNRISAFYSFQEKKNKQSISYDFFSNKLGGGWGIAASNNKLFDISEANINLAYSPKITFKMKDITWAPGFGVHINHKYKQEYNIYCFLCGDLQGDKG